MAKKSKAEDLLDVKPSKQKPPKKMTAEQSVAQAAQNSVAIQGVTPVRQQGDAAVYCRSKSTPIPLTVQPEMKWLLVIAGVPQFFAERAACFKAYKAAIKGTSAPTAPRAKKAKTDTLPLGATEPLDEDLHAVSEAGPHAVPSVWRTDGGRYGLLVYYGRTRAKMVSCSVIGSGYAVQKLDTEQLYASQQRAVMAMVESQRGRAQPRDIQPGEYWWPAESRYTPEHFCNVYSTSQLTRSDSAAAFIDKLLCEADDLLLVGGGTTEEEELLS